MRHDMTSLGVGTPATMAASHQQDLAALKAADLAPWIDHTLLKAQATQHEIDQLVREAREHRFASVCVNPYWIPSVVKGLDGTSVRACTVISFPLGASSLTAKRAEARAALDQGATELDLVMNIGALKSAHLGQVVDECRALVELCQGQQLIKLILETALLSPFEVQTACQLAVQGGVHFVKTSTGFGPGGATLAMIRLMRDTVGEHVGVKASGGIRDTASALAMVQAGATRLGTSASLGIIRGPIGESRT